MIRSSRATLSVYSDELTSADITARIGVAPQTTREKGSPRPSGSGVYERAHWSFDTKRVENTPDDEAGSSSIRLILETFRPVFDRVAALRV